MRTHPETDAGGWRDNGVVEPPARQRLIAALRGDERLEIVELRLLAQVEAVLENAGSRIAIGIGAATVHPHSLTRRREATKDGQATLFRAQPFAVELVKGRSHLIVQFDPFDRADVREPVTTENENCRRAWSPTMGPAGMVLLMTHDTTIGEKRRGWTKNAIGLASAPGSRSSPFKGICIRPERVALRWNGR